MHLQRETLDAKSKPNAYAGRFARIHYANVTGFCLEPVTARATIGPTAAFVSVVPDTARFFSTRLIFDPHRSPPPANYLL
jgi:hypothetical protein